MDKSAIQAIQETNAASLASRQIEERELDAVVLPNGHALHSIESYMNHPRKFRGCFTTNSTDAFKAYLEKFAQTNPHCFVNKESMQAQAILDFGSTELPEHRSNTAYLVMEKTPEFAALNFPHTLKLEQRQLAEFLEDWAINITCYAGDTQQEIKKAITAVRNTTIERIRKGESQVENLKESQSLMESVEAKSEHGLPSNITFTCDPYEGLNQRIVNYRVSVIDNGKPIFHLHPVKPTALLNEIADEFANLVRTVAPKGTHTLVGKFQCP